MSLHLQGKVSRLIGDLRALFVLVDLIEHELEKRIVARHVLVKIDSFLDLLPRLKNEYRRALYGNDGSRVRQLEALISRLDRDYPGSQMALVRDALVGHALKLDALKVDEAWHFMCATTFGILASDIEEIESELASVAGRQHIPAGIPVIDPAWPELWRQSGWLGAAYKPRVAVIYPAFGNANIISPIPTVNAVQDSTLRAGGLATFLRQVRILLEPTPPGSTAERLFLEMILNDYFALWELLFTGGVRNTYGDSEEGDVDPCVLDHWRADTDPFRRADCLAALRAHPDFDRWKNEVRNRVSAHVDPDVPIWVADLNHWPMTRAELLDEVGRVVTAVYECAIRDSRSKVLFMPPTELKGDCLVLKSAGGWDDAQ